MRLSSGFIVVAVWICALGSCDNGGLPAVGGDELIAEAGEGSMCACELRSWVVAGRGRHMYLEIDCPDEFDHLDGVVEFGSAMQRSDWRGRWERENMPRVAKINRGVRIEPVLVEADNRLEAEYAVTLEQASELHRDRLWEDVYRLLGPNSTSAMLRALSEAKLALPEHVLAEGRPFASFPGAEFELGEEAVAERWGEFGLPDGPEEAPTPAPERVGDHEE